MTQHEDQAVIFVAASIPTGADTIPSRDIVDSSTLSDSDPGSSKITNDIANSQEIISPSMSGKFDVPSPPQFQDSRFLSSVRGHPGRTAELTILPRIPKHKRHDVKKIEKSNNQSGRTGNFRCTLCHKRRSKYIFVSKTLLCNFCLANYISESCVKLWGSKTHVPKMPTLLHGSQNIDDTIPSRNTVWDQMPMLSETPSDYNPSVDSKYLRLLEWVYRNEFSPSLHGATRVFALIQKFTGLYGPSIIHPSLRYAVCAYSAFSHSGPPEYDDYNTEEFVQRTRAVLKKRFDDLTLLDEGDLFAVFLLAMCESDELDSFYIHLEGFVSFVEFLFGKNQENLPSDTFSAFWKTAHDELVYCIWQSAITPSRKNDIVAQFHETFRKVFGNTAFRKDSKSRNGDDACFSSTTFLVTSWQQFLVLRDRVRGQVEAHSNLEADTEFYSMMPDIQSHLYRVDENEALDYLSAKLVEVVKQKASDTFRVSVQSMHQALHIGASLFWRRLSRLFLAVLEDTTSPRGKCSSNVDAALEAIFLMLHRIETAFKDIELTFCECPEVFEEEGTENVLGSRCPLHHPRYYKRDIDGYFEWVTVNENQHCGPSWTWLDFRKNDFLVMLLEIWDANDYMFDLLFNNSIVTSKSYGYSGWLTKEFMQYICINSI